MRGRLDIWLIRFVEDEKHYLNAQDLLQNRAFAENDSLLYNRLKIILQEKIQCRSS